MTTALDDAGLKPEDISYINAHGTGTFYNDSIETLAIKKSFGEETARKLAISSTKAMTGHLLGAAGAVEAIACVLSINDQQVPATINFKEADEACDLDYVTEGTRKMAVAHCMSNSLGFGGHNACIIISQYEA